MLEALIGVGCLTALALVIVVAYVLRWVIFVTGFLGLIFVITYGPGAAIVEGDTPEWVAFVALGSLACLAVGMVLVSEELDR